MTFERTHEHEIDVRTESDHVSHLHLHYSTTRTKPMQTKHSQLFSTHTYPTQKKIKRYSLTLSSFSPTCITSRCFSEKLQNRHFIILLNTHTPKNEKERRQRKWITVFSTIHILLSLQQQKFHTQEKRAFLFSSSSSSLLLLLFSAASSSPAKPFLTGSHRTKISY